MHIARVWERYSDSSNYFGGIVAFTRQQFIKVNGFPNNFWGWGGEDNELYCRVVRKKLIVETPTRSVSCLHFDMLLLGWHDFIALDVCVCGSGTIRDLEAMSLEEKLTVLRKSKWKCTVKHELLKEHHRTWKKNGLKSLHYEFVDAEAINEHCTKITVKLGPNGHWSDARTSLEHSTAPNHDLAACMVLPIATTLKTTADSAFHALHNAPGQMSAFFMSSVLPYPDSESAIYVARDPLSSCCLKILESDPVLSTCKSRRLELPRMHRTGQVAYELRLCLLTSAVKTIASALVHSSQNDSPELDTNATSM